MIVQEDVPYTKEEVKAMVKTIHDLREKLSLLGWHPASKLPKEGELVLVSGSFKNRIIGASGAIFSKGEFYVASTFDDPKVSRCIITGIKWWCYPPEED